MAVSGRNRVSDGKKITQPFRPITQRDYGAPCTSRQNGAAILAPFRLLKLVHDLYIKIMLGTV
jgi:hypothetical protein